MKNEGLARWKWFLYLKPWEQSALDQTMKQVVTECI